MRGGGSLLALAIAAIAPQVQAAPEDGSIGVLPPAHSGAFEGDQLQRFADEVVAVLSDAGLVGQARDSAEDCTASDCLRELAGRSGDRYLLRASVAEASRNYDLSLELIDGATGEVVASTTGSCEICGWGEVQQSLRDAMGQIVRKLEDVGDRAAVLVVRGKPDGAQVRVDGEVIGETPLETAVGAGEHEVVIEKPGFTSQRWDWQARPGVREDFGYRLSPLDTSGRKIPPVWGALALGTGVALLGGGVTMIALDGRPHARTCLDERKDVDGDCPNVLATRGPGVALAVVGAVAAGAGIALLTISLRKREGKSAASLTPVLGPQGVRLRGHF